MEMHQFDQDTSLIPGEPSTFSGHITKHWSINGIPNGGYLMAILAKAMMQKSEFKSTPIITANFLERSETGKAEISIERMALSRQFNRMQAVLNQNGKEKIRAFGTFASEKNQCLLENYEKSAPEITKLENCTLVPELPNYPLFGQMDVRLDPACTGWFSGKLSDRSETRGFVKFKNDRPFDVLSVLLIADSFPPAVMTSQGMVAWIPTLEFSVNIRNVAATKWLKCVFRTHFITCGLLEEDGEIWDQDDRLIAISRQISQYRSP
jgi:hypothetical protein